MAGRKPKEADPFAALAVGLAADHAAAKLNPPAEAEVGGQTPADGDEALRFAGVTGPAPEEATASDEQPPALPDEGEVTAKFQRRLDRLVNIVEEAEFESGTAQGDLRDLLSELFQARDKPFHMLDANERRTLVQHLDKVAQLVLRKVVQVVAEEDSITLQATMLDKLAVSGDALELKLKVEHVDAEVLMSAYKMAGSKVVVVSASDKRFSGARRPIPPGETQAEIPFADAPKPSATAPAPVPAAAPPADDSDLAGEYDEPPAPEPEPEPEPAVDADAFVRSAGAKPVTEDLQPSEPAADEPAETVPGEGLFVVLATDMGEFIAQDGLEGDGWTADRSVAKRFTRDDAEFEAAGYGEGVVIQPADQPAE